MKRKELEIIGEPLNPEKVKAILQEFKRDIESVLHSKLVEIVLYGSYARGDYEFGSDIDILLVVNEKLTEKERDKISFIASKISLKYETVISCFDYPLYAFQSWETPFLMNVRREGIRI